MVAARAGMRVSGAEVMVLMMGGRASPEEDLGLGIIPVGSARSDGAALVVEVPPSGVCPKLGLWSSCLPSV